MRVNLDNDKMTARKSGRNPFMVRVSKTWVGYRTFLVREIVTENKNNKRLKGESLCWLPYLHGDKPQPTPTYIM